MVVLWKLILKCWLVADLNVVGSMSIFLAAELLWL